jgi:hypothetical protein
LDALNLIVEDKKLRAIQGESLYRKAKEKCHTIQQELEKVIITQIDLDKKDCIHVQLDNMKKEDGISFSSQPIFHLDVPLEDSGRNVIVVKACGYYNQWYHCGDVALPTCKHTFHPLCLVAMLKDSNK